VAPQAAAAAVAASEAAGKHSARMSSNGKYLTALNFLEDGMSFKHHGTAFNTPALLLMLLIPLAACNNNTNNQPEKPSIKTFASPDEAGSALITAVKSADQPALLTIFGPDSKELISSGDAVEDKNIGKAVAERYDTMHRWRKMPDGSQILLIGADNFPFPIPLKKNSDGWFFDTAAGKDEVLSRRIGRNELAIIDVCNAIAAAEADYYAHPHDGQPAKQFAAKLLSDPGKQNGLYWKADGGQPPSPLGPLVASATTEGYAANPNGHAPFHGYYFHRLTGQTDKAPGGAKEYTLSGKMAGFAFVAYPAEYGNSGIMTFIINQDGVLLQKDLGKTTTETATAMTQFDPDSSWSIVGQ
jgi:hypothetical protein